MSRCIVYVMVGLVIAVMSSVAGCGNLYSMSSVKTQTTAKARVGANVAAGNLVTMDGSQSVGANGGPLAYHWTIISKPEGSSATLSNPDVVNPTFIADLAGQYALELQVTDNGSNSSTDAVTVTVIAAGIAPAPVADAGVSRSAVIGSPVVLDGSASSSGNGSLLAYSWTCISRPEGSLAELSGATAARPVFTPDRAGTYVFRLVVAAGDVRSAASSTTVTADTLNGITLSPGDTTLGLGQAQQFFASGSFVTAGTMDISVSATWSSSDTAVASVSNRGLVTALSPGTTTVSAQLAGTTSSVTVVVGSPSLASLKIEKGPVIPPIPKGQTLQLTATATYSDKSQKDVTELATWALKSPLSDCITVSDQPGTKGLIATTDRTCYIPVVASFEGRQITAYVTVK